MYWYRYITGKQTILALLVYNLLLKYIHNNIYNLKLISSVKYVLDDIGYTYYGYHSVVRVLVPRLLILGLVTIIYNHGILILIARLRLQVKSIANTVIFEIHLSFFGEKTHWCPLLHFRLSYHNLPRWKMYRYKIDYVLYVAILISEINFMTFLPVYYNTCQYKKLYNS